MIDNRDLYRSNLDNQSHDIGENVDYIFTATAFASLILTKDHVAGSCLLLCIVICKGFNITNRRLALKKVDYLQEVEALEADLKLLRKVSDKPDAKQSEVEAIEKLQNDILEVEEELATTERKLNNNFSFCVGCLWASYFWFIVCIVELIRL